MNLQYIPSGAAVELRYHWADAASGSDGDDLLYDRYVGSLAIKNNSSTPMALDGKDKFDYVVHLEATGQSIIRVWSMGPHTFRAHCYLQGCQKA